MSMSSELQAIMQRRLAKSNVKQDQLQPPQEEGEQDQGNQPVVSNINDNNVVRMTRPSIVMKEEKEKNANTPTAAASRFKFASKKSPLLVEAKREEEPAVSPVSDFKRNIALFNQVTPKNSKTLGNVGNNNNTLKSPVAAKANSTSPFGETIPKARFFESKASNKIPNKNDLQKRNYNHQTSPTASSSGGLRNNNNHQRRSSNVDTHKEKHKVVKEQGLIGTKLVVTQPSPPSSSSSPPAVDSDQKSLSLTHVQAMKLKFLLKNPEPRPISPPANNVVGIKSKLKSSSVNFKDTKLENPVTTLKPEAIQNDLKDVGSTGPTESSSLRLEEKSADVVATTDEKETDEIEKAFDKFSPFRENKVYLQNTVGNKYDDDNISIDGKSKSGANGDFEPNENLFATFEDVAATSNNNYGNIEFSDTGVDWGWNQDFFTGGVDEKGGCDKEMITSDLPPFSRGVGKEEDGINMSPPSYDFGTESMFMQRKVPFEDDDDEETLMEGNMDSEAGDEIVIKSFDLLKFNPQNCKSCLSSQNPVNGNVIMCSIRKKRWYIDELEVSPKIKVVSTMEISCSMIHQKMKDKDIIPCGIKDVLGITGGVQISHKGGREVYVIVLLSLYALGSTGAVDVFAVWRWGCVRDGNADVPDAIITPPALDYEYEPKSFISADGLIFVSTTVRRKPVVLVSKPSVCSKWVSYFSDFENSPSQRIIHMDICPEGKLMALVFSDGVACIWNYKAAIGLHPNFSTTNQMKLLYMLEDESSFVPTSNKVGTSGTNDDILIKRSEKSCRSLQWLCSLNRLPSSITTTSAFILAASFLTGVAVYAIPMTKTNEPTTSELSTSATLDYPQSKPGETMTIYPFALTSALFSEVQNLNGAPTLKWIYAGEGLFPLLATILIHEERVFLHVGSLELPSERTARETERAARETKMISMKTVTTGDFSLNTNTALNFHGCNFEGSILAHSPGQLTAFCVTSRQSLFGLPRMHPNMMMKSLPVSSDALGVTSDGSVLQSFSDIIHIQKTYHFDVTVHRKSIGSEQYITIFPYQRHWLCRSITGDVTSQVSREAGDEFPKGGARTSILFDLDSKVSSVTPLIPRRILRDRHGKNCLILFEDGSVTPSQRTSNNIIAFGLMEVPLGDKVVVDEIVVHEGNDACFRAPGTTRENHIIMLDSKAKSLRMLSMLSLKGELEGNGNVTQLFKKGSSNDVNLAVERVMVASDQILLLCSRKADGRQCLFLGGTLESLERNKSEFLVRKKTSKFWLNESELFLSMIQLPTDNDDTISIVAISTTARVIILSLGLKLRVLSQCSASVTCDNLAQIGSQTVAFLENCDAGQRLSYLSAFSGNTVGVISNMSSGWAQSLLLVALRPDRIIYLTTQNSSSRIWSYDDDSISIPLILTRPLLLLEPLVTNACGQSRSTDERNHLLRTIFEKFGPKKISNPHQENEGIGTFGAGITPKLFSIVGSSLKELLKESEDGKEIAYWIPRSDTKLPDLQGASNFSLGTLDDAQHVWYLGPNGNRSELLLLDSFEEWLGKECPSIIGEVGAEMAAETGERTLLNILATAKGVTDGNQQNDNDHNETETDNLDNQGWVRGVGEGRKDEDNLSLYIRFSEGSEELWREKDIRDLSKYENKVVLLKQESLDIQPTTSNVDEGEPGKVHPLYDLVFKEDSQDHAPAFVIEVPRGSALDVGMLHSSCYSSRRRATLEFWFYVPNIPSEVVLVRRSLLSEHCDYRNADFSNENNHLLWELVATPVGYLEFRTKAGTAFNSEYATNVSHDNSDFDRVDTQDDRGKISLPKETGYGGWNHVTLSFSSDEAIRTQTGNCNIDQRRRKYVILVGL